MESLSYPFVTSREDLVRVSVYRFEDWGFSFASFVSYSLMMFILKRYDCLCVYLSYLGYWAYFHRATYIFI